MMRSVYVVIAAFIGLAGCIGAPKRSVNWIIDSEHAGLTADDFRKTWSAGRVSVRMPYDNQSIAVLRPDGTVAFDPVNTFAATPSRLIKGLLEDMCGCGQDGAPPLPDEGETLDVNVTLFALDCVKSK